MANDCFRFRQFTVHQDRCGMKVGTDGTLLGAWAAVPPSTLIPQRILDIGTGTGLIALMMAQRFPAALITAIDIDATAAEQARENVAASPFAGSITVVCGDVRTLSSAEAFDAIVCNPPFFHDSLHSPDARRTLARHSDTLTFRQLTECARRLLSDSGELSVVIPAEGKSLMESEAALAGLFKVRHCNVSTTPAKPPKRCLMAFRKHPAPTEVTELVIGSEACRLLTEDFYL